eukprot:6257678-Pyramimonas_sp.AAC.1
MPMAKSKARVFAGQACYGVEACHPVRSSYSAERLAAAYNLEDCYPTVVTARAPRRAANSHPVERLFVKQRVGEADWAYPSRTHQLDATDDGARKCARHS